MPATVSHALSMTTPDDPAYENQPQHWNSAHLFTLNAVGSELTNAFGNGGGVTFGLSADGKITASAPAGGGGLTNINVSAGTTSNNLSALTFSNGSGVTFGLNASTLTASVATSYRASNDAIGLNSALTANGVSVTANSAGLSLNFPAFLTTAMLSNAATISNINVSAGTTSNNLSALTFSNGSGVTFGLNASTLTASVATSYRVSNDAVGLNTALTAGPLAWTVNSAGISLNAGSAAGTTSGFAGNLISGSMTHNTAGLNLSVNHPAWLTTAAQSNHSHGNPTLALTNLSGTTASASNGFTLSLSANAQSVQPVAISGSNGSFLFSTVTFGNLNGLSFYTSNGSIVGSYTDAGAGGGISAINVSAGTTSNNMSALTFSDGGNVSFGLNGSVITASVPSGGGGLTRAYFDNLGPLNTISGALGTKQAQDRQVQVFPLKPYQDLFNGSMTVNTMLMEMSVSGSTATLSAAGISTLFRFGLYTLVTTGATLSLSLINSFGKTFGLAGAATNNSTYWQGRRWLSVHSSEWSSQPVLSNDIHYFCGLHISTVGSTAQTFAMIGGFGGSTIARSGFLGQATANATHNGDFGAFLGVYGTTTAALPTGINYTQINRQSASANFIPHIIGHTYTNLTMP